MPMEHHRVLETARVVGRGVSVPAHARGSVFSVHARALNARVSGSDELLTVTLDPESMTVSSLLLERAFPPAGFHALRSEPGDSFVLEPSRLRLASTEVPLAGTRGAAVFDGSITRFGAQGAATIARLADAARRARPVLLDEIDRIGRGRGFGALARLLHDGAARPGFAPEDPFARAAWRRIGGADPGDAGVLLAGLIGLGQGLTPSGDDFTVGFLAARALLGAPPHDAQAAQRILDRLATTTAHGATVVRQALRGRFPAYLCHFAEAFATAVTSGDMSGVAVSPDRAVAGAVAATVPGAVARAAEHGHSSGIDALVGFAVGLGGSVDR